MIKTIFLMLPIMLLLAGCSDKRKTVEHLYVEYLENTQNLNKQKEIMFKTISAINPIKKENKGEMFYDSFALMMSYLRLSVIAEKEGDLKSSDIYLSKARYWFVVSRESIGESKDLIYDGYLEFTPESRMKLITGLDKNNLNLLENLKKKGSRGQAPAIDK